jgi:hypothetical protein
MITNKESIELRRLCTARMIKIFYLVWLDESIDVYIFFDNNLIRISFFDETDESSNQNLNTLCVSFIYTPILEEILLIIDFKQVHLDEFIKYCRHDRERMFSPPTD